MFGEYCNKFTVRYTSVIYMDLDLFFFESSCTEALLLEFSLKVRSHKQLHKYICTGI